MTLAPATVGRYRHFRALVLIPLWLLLLPLMACTSTPAKLSPAIVERYPHDPQAFTQGLLYEEGRLFESTGLRGASTVREVDLESGEVVRSRPLAANLFGEGLALVGDRLIQLTWQAGVALVYDLATFEQLDSYSYEGEGWGICFDGEELWMTDGSPRLTVRDPQTFEIKRSLVVRLEDEPVSRLNEVECVGGHVYANVWLSDEIVRIDKDSGRVDAVIDASRLLSAGERELLSPDAVLNGIAYDEDEDLFYLTGKLWPALFAVEFE